MLLAPVPVITAADLFMEFAIPSLYRLMAMDLLQLTVLALKLAKEHGMSALSVFGHDRIPGALFPPVWFDCLSICAFHFDDFHFSSGRVGSDKLMSVCNGGICIFISVNKREMRSRAPRLLLCDRNHIIDWHTESCPSSSPRRATAASEENKGRLEAAGVCGQTPSHCLALPFALSLCLSQSFTTPTRNNGKGDRGAEYRAGGLFPVSEYSRCHLCSLELLHPARL